MVDRVLAEQDTKPWVPSPALYIVSILSHAHNLGTQEEEAGISGVQGHLSQQSNFQVSLGHTKSHLNKKTNCKNQEGIFGTRKIAQWLCVLPVLLEDLSVVPIRWLTTAVTPGSGDLALSPGP